MDQSILSLWEERTAPIMDSIIFSDNSLIVMDIRHTYDDNYEAIPLVRANLSSFFEFNEMDYTSDLTALKSITIKDGDLRVTCGEGSYGSDGFVALETSNNKLIWLFFSQKTNPFVDIQEKNGHILVKNNLGIIWDFSIKEPYKIEVVK